MAMKRRGSKLASPAKRRRRMLRRIPRAPRSNDNAIVRKTIVLHQSSWTFATNSSSDWWKRWTCQLSSCSNYAQYQAMFDRYRIRGFKVTFLPQVDTVNIPYNSTAVPGFGKQYLWVNNDVYDNTTPTGLYGQSSLNAFLASAKPRCKLLTGPKPISVYVKNPVVYTEGSSQTKRSPWLQTSSATVSHYGCATFWQQNAFDTLPALTVDVIYEVYVEFKDLKL